MKKFLWGCVALVGLFVVAESLNCNTCSVGIGGVCLFGKTTTCSITQPNCYTGLAVFNFSSTLKIKTKGCLDSPSCNMTYVNSVLGAGYSVTTFCCSSTDLCNGAGVIQPHLTVALGAALVAVRSIFA
ncbi:lymphocyte antigen 6B [Esox lucius]|uniref:lymphocyte antigen 6B n=1 Tax=Esox lucius TaxID=8010 RepID=UPI0005774759|nr:lymphocyte antigen 6B [Esox lucius]